MHQVSITLDQLAAQTGWLRRLARSLVHDAAAAEDLVHDAYVIAAERPPDAPLAPWLVRVMTNLSRMRLRGAARRDVRERAVAALADAPPTPHELAERLELHRLLAGLVLALTPQARDVVLLVYVEGLSSSAAGRRLGIPASTVRWRLRQALSELRAKLDDRKPRKAWLAALAGFGWPKRAAAAALPWLVAAGIAVVVAAGWLARELQASAGSAYGLETSTERTREGTVARMLAEPTAVHKEMTLRAAGLSFAPLEQNVLVGRVVDEYGAPVADADVELDCAQGDPGENPAAGRTRVRSRSDGLFVFVRQLGCWSTLSARKDDRAGFLDFAGETRDQVFDVALRATQPVAVRVVDDATGAAIADAQVSVRSMMVSLDQAGTDRHGEARLRWLDPGWASSGRDPDGIYSIFAASHPDYSSGWAKATSRRALARTTTIRLTRGIAVRGQVRDPNDQPVANALVAFGGAPRSGAMGPQLPRGVYADGDGRFEIHIASAGTYALHAGTTELMSTRADEATLVVPAQGRDEVVIHVEPRTNAGVEGVVVDAGGAPVAGATVMAAGSSFVPVTTDARGAFAFRVATARLQLIARAGEQASDYTPVDIVRGKVTHVALRVERAGITGVVVDRDDHSIAHAQVWLNQVERDGDTMIAGRRFLTDDHGAFSIDVPRGPFRLSVRRSFEDDFLDEDDMWVEGGSRDVKLTLP